MNSCPNGITPLNQSYRLFNPLSLVDLRQKPTFEILGLLFDVSRIKANSRFNYWVEILREILPVSQIEEAKKDEQKYQELCEARSEYKLIIDSV